MKNEELNMRATLSLIMKHEGGTDEDRYKKKYGGSIITDTKEHPGSYLFNETTYSAAGAYQFLKTTWTGLEKKLNLPDFSPESQDKAAVEKIKERKAYNFVTTGDLNGAIDKLTNEWVSLPGGSQSNLSKEDANKEYNEYIVKELKGESLVKTKKGELIK